MSITIYTPDDIGRTAERVRGDFGAFAYDGFGIKLSDQQLEAHAAIGAPGPRQPRESKVTMLSGGTRSGKTVFGALLHCEAGLYKLGVDRTDSMYWDNYDYGTLAGAPTDELALRMHGVLDAISKGASDAQFDTRRRRARPGKFLQLLKLGKQGAWGICRLSNGAHIDFRSFEGRAYRLEGGQWWLVTWDEWASQPEHEIHDIKTNVLLARARDHDAKIVMMAWPKRETERHLIEADRKIMAGTLSDHQIVYMSAEEAHFTNRNALAVEKRTKTDAEYRRTVLGRPAGGAMVEFKPHMLDRMFRPIPRRETRVEGFRYLSTWDLGLGQDDTVGLTFRIPIIDGKPIVAAGRDGQPWARARIVHDTELKASESLTLDMIGFEVIREQQSYNSLSAVDATGLGGLMAFRLLRETMKPPPIAFVSNSNDRIHGNIRLAAITNGLDLLTWGRSDARSDELGEGGYEWGLVEASDALVRLRDQMANFDREAKKADKIHDDWVWALLIGLWFIKRFYLVRGHVHVAREFNVAARPGTRSRLIRPRHVDPAVSGGVRLIQPRR